MSSDSVVGIASTWFIPSQINAVFTLTHSEMHVKTSPKNGLYTLAHWESSRTYEHVTLGYP